MLVHLYPPLNMAAGRSRVTLSLDVPAELGAVIGRLVEEFGPEFRRYLYDTDGRLIPAWAVFVNGEPVQLNRPDSLATCVADGDELSFILNVAGG